MYRYPQRVQKKKAVVRFMFHNPEDVRWFKVNFRVHSNSWCTVIRDQCTANGVFMVQPLELSTKYGRRGRIKEPVGTHGKLYHLKNLSFK